PGAVDANVHAVAHLPARLAPDVADALALVVTRHPAPLAVAPLPAPADPDVAAANLPALLAQHRRRNDRTGHDPVALDANVDAIAQFPAPLAPPPPPPLPLP